MTKDVEDFLAHYGVKGMRWGVRRKARKAHVQRGREAMPKAKAQLNDAKNSYEAAKRMKKGEAQAKLTLSKAKAVRARALADGVRTKSGATTVGLFFATGVLPVNFILYPITRVGLRVNATRKEKKYQNLKSKGGG